METKEKKFNLPMKKYRELSYKELYKRCDLRGFNFKTTEEFQSIEGVIEQQRAIKSLKMGLKIDKKNYNIYVGGVSGTGKTSIVKSILNSFAKEKKTPLDICYIYNFKNPDSPSVLFLPPGEGRKLKKQIEQLIEELKEEFYKTFQAKEHLTNIQNIVNIGVEKQNEYFAELNRFAENLGFTVKATKAGIVTIPVINAHPITEKEYAELNKEVREKIENKRRELGHYVNEFLQKTRDIEIKTREKIQSLYKELTKEILAIKFKPLREKFSHLLEVQDYLNSVENNMIENFPKFLPEDIGGEGLQKLKRKRFLEYEVNVIVDNFETKGAPVIYESNPSYHNLFGKIEKKVENGIYFTDFTMIKAGSVVRANNGYLIINAKDLLSHPFSWEILKNVLKNRSLIIEDIGEHYSFLPTSGLKPEPIPIDCKVILIGSNSIYFHLYNLDEDFRKLFQIKADFDYEIEKNRLTINEYIQFISTACRNDCLKHVLKDGVAAVIEYGSRLVESQEKMTLRFNEISNILVEANQFAIEDNSQYIARKHVIKAIKEKEYRQSLIADKIFKEMIDDYVLIEVNGEKVGQANGLAVYNAGGHLFGKPLKITARVYQGKSGIISIEREAKLSGNIHNKGVLIVSGYLGGCYAQDTPLSLNISLCFEQSYVSIDGDSASSAEIFAILSALSGVPIKQGIASTGSVSQKGEILPVGGINYKIEGFFRLCKSKGLTSEQGVIIPEKNVKNLMLNEEVREAVRKKLFHIYPIKTVDEGVEILTRMKSGVLDKDGNYPEGTIHYLCKERLKKYSEKKSD